MIARIWRSRGATLMIAIAILWSGQASLSQGQPFGYFDTAIGLLGLLLFAVRER